MGPPKIKSWIRHKRIVRVKLSETTRNGTNNNNADRQSVRRSSGGMTGTRHRRTFGEDVFFSVDVIFSITIWDEQMSKSKKKPVQIHRRPVVWRRRSLTIAASTSCIGRKLRSDDGRTDTRYVFYGLQIIEDSKRSSGKPSRHTAGVRGGCRVVVDPEI